jgi:hypothetical protein
VWPVLTGSGPFWEGPGRTDPTTAPRVEKIQPFNGRDGETMKGSGRVVVVLTEIVLAEIGKLKTVSWIVVVS